MSKKKSNEGKDPILNASVEERDKLRMKRSGAAASGYHAPTPQDIEDIKKDHTTATTPGVLNADEGVRRDAEDSPGPINSLSGKVEETAEEEQQSA